MRSRQMQSSWESGDTSYASAGELSQALRRAAADTA
jgi:hypothetical protein